MSRPAIEVDALTKTYAGTAGNPAVAALRNVQLRVSSGEKLAVLGPSGAGKSTLLNVLGLLDKPTSGSYALFGQETTFLSSRERDQLRARSLGFVFQAYHVLGHRTVMENVRLKLTSMKAPGAGRDELIHHAIDRVGLLHRSAALGMTLSGGEKQRLAIARAIVNLPQMLLADEPTGNLDEDNAASVLELFDQQARAGVTVIVITHDARTAVWADRTIRIVDGSIEGT